MKLKEFYADPRRAESAEVDFGGSWRGYGRGPWRVVWLRETGELVAFDVAALQGWEPTGLGGDAGFFIEGALAAVSKLFGRRAAKARRRPDRDDVVVLGVSQDAGELRRPLHGWEQHEGDERGLEWLTARTDRVWGPAAEPTPTRAPGTGRRNRRGAGT
ncbi:MAG TPA: hypothetical protein VF183_01660 [Acidimicrobiales bacterium]